MTKECSRAQPKMLPINDRFLLIPGPKKPKRQNQPTNYYQTRLKNKYASLKFHPITIALIIHDFVQMIVFYSCQTLSLFTHIWTALQGIITFW